LAFNFRAQVCRASPLTLSWRRQSAWAAGPALALALAPLFGLDGIERAVGVLQAAMPAAVLASIIAVENDLLPEFVITTVLFSTLLSIVTLTIVLAIV